MAKLWVMFFTSLLLVSTMNFYAVIREPDMIDIDEIHEYPRETVKVLGVLTSYVVDPYGEQADRIDLQIREVDGHSVVEVRWYVDRDVDVPPIGTIVTVEGEVTEWNGRIWLSSNGYGAIQCADSNCDGIEYTAVQIVEVAMNPKAYSNMSVKVDGYLSESLEPDVTYHSLSLMDNPSYGNADHLLYMQVEGRVMDWVEAGSHVEISGWLQYDQRSLRWRLLVQATAVEVYPGGNGSMVDLSWELEPYSLSYEVGKLVSIEGTANELASGWWLSGPSPNDVLCMLPSPSDLDEGIEGVSKAWTGRLTWSTDEAIICLDRGYNASAANPTGDFGEGVTPLLDVAASPFDYLGQNLTFEGWVTDPISPDYDKGYVGDGPDYYSRSTKLRMHLIGEHTEWIEGGQAIRFNATIIWSESEGRIILEARTWTLGEAPDPGRLNWGDGYNSWKWDIGRLVTITGEAEMDSDGEQWVYNSGTEERICLLGDGTEASQQESIGEPIDWTGRLSTTEDSVGNTMQFCLDIR
ncbi:MAG: hypothetical protein QF365_05655 [Candidatus Thalassarchaeaceae archaeon]|nr:hypothetical protein [Candidatus Thalassarchaeaceae archaeon]MDP6318165.1 hypothetical protein [Candidatus Thalassarchaeaceae archaeon]